VILWLIGQPGAGKTTLARELLAYYKKVFQTVVYFDGEELRRMSANADFTAAGREKNVALMQELAAKLDASGITIIVAMVTPYRWQREQFKKRCRVFEIYLHADNATRPCSEHRVSDFAPPEGNFLDVDTGTESVTDSAKRIITWVNNATC